MFAGLEIAKSPKNASLDKNRIRILFFNLGFHFKVHSNK